MKRTLLTSKSRFFFGYFVVILVLFGLSACRASMPEMLSEASSDGFGDFGMDADEGEYAQDYKEERSAGFSSNNNAIAVERMVIKNADLSIVVEEPESTMKIIASMAEELGGFVVASNLYQTQMDGGNKTYRGSITIRVPAEKLEETLERVKSSASQVLSENISGQDVTREYTDLKSRLRNLESAEIQLMTIMENARETEDVLDVYNNLVNVREQIEVIKGQMQYYEQAASLSAVSVEVFADEDVQPLTIGGWKPGGVAKDAIQTLINTLQWIGDGIIWSVLCILPVALIGAVPAGIVFLTFRRIRRRRKGNDKEEISGDAV